MPSLSKSPVGGVHNIALGMDMVLCAVQKEGNNLPSYLTLEWRRTNGGLMTVPQVFSGINPNCMPDLADKGFSYYRSYMGKTSRTGNFPVSTERDFGKNSKSRDVALELNLNGKDTVVEPLDRILTLRQATELIAHVKGKLDLKIGKIGYKRGLNFIHALASYSSPKREIAFLPDHPIKMSTVLHELTHAFIDQNCDEYKNRRGWYLDYHPPLFHILYSKLCAEFMGTDENFHRWTMDRKGILGGLKEHQTQIILSDVWGSACSRPRTKPLGYSDPPLISAETGFEYVWKIGGQGRHYASRPKFQGPRNMRN